MTNERLLCPNCPQKTREVNKVRGTGTHTITVGMDLDICITNYSGCGVDIAECPACGKRFQISYKVDEIMEIT